MTTIDCVTSSGQGPSLVECGRVGRPVGLKGEVMVVWMSGACPVDVGGELSVAPAEKQSSHRSVRVAALRRQGRSSVVRFDGVTDRAAAEGLRNARLFIPAESLSPLAAGEYYSYQILGCEVVTEEGRLLGTVVRIFSAGTADVYEVRSGEDGPPRELLVPATDEVVRSVDIASRRIVIRPLQGMLEEPRDH